MSDIEFDQQPGAEGRNGPGVFLILMVIIAAIIAIFVVQNGDRAQIEFLFFDVQSRIWLAIAIAIGLGVVLDRAILAWWRRARKNKNG